MAHRQLYSYALQPSYAAAAAASAVSPAPPPQPPKTGLSSLYGSSADHYFPDTTFRYLARDGSEALSNYSASLGTLTSSSAMYHHLPNTTASHLAYPQLLQHQEAAWPPGVEVPGVSSAVEPLPPGVKRTSEVIDFTAAWCGPCKAMEPRVKEIASKYSEAVFAKVDVDRLMDVAGTYRANTLPAFVFVKRGEEIDRVVGAKPDELENKIEKHRV